MRYLIALCLLALGAATADARPRPVRNFIERVRPGVLVPKAGACAPAVYPTANVRPAVYPAGGFAPAQFQPCPSGQCPLPRRW